MEILVFVGGVACGALTAILWRMREDKKEHKEEAKPVEDSVYMQTQYANFFNYDGTTKGQMPLEE